MKRSLAFTVLCIICAAGSFAQHALCVRVGGVIDATEREYFGLFPNVEGFVSATAAKQADGSVALTIRRSVKAIPSDTSLTDTALTIDAHTAGYFAMFVENFETFRRNPNSAEWHTLNGLVDHDHVSSNGIDAGVELLLEYRDGEKLRGRILFVDDSSLVIWGSLSEFHYSGLQFSAKRVRISDIQRIIIEQEGGFLTGFGYGALIGGAGAAIFGGVMTSALAPLGADMSAFIPLTLAGALAVGLIGGAIEAIGGIDTVIDDVWIVNEFGETASDRLCRYAVFTSLPPPELLRFANP